MKRKGILLGFLCACGLAMQAQIGVDIVEPTTGSHTFSTLTASRSAFRLGLGTAFNSAYVLNISGAADTIGGIAVAAPAGKRAIYSSASLGGYSGYLTGGTFYTTSLVKLANQVYFGSGLKSLLSGDQGGAIGLIGTASTSTPYIDFRNLTTASGTMPDARIVLDNTQKMNLYSPQGIVMNHDVTCQGSLSSSSNMMASNSVRVGITQDWGGQLQIYNGAANGPATILMQGGNAAGTGGQGRFWIVSQNNQLQLGKAASSVPTMGAINIKYNGLVGINTDAPSKTLDVNGTLNVSDNATFVKSLTWGTSTLTTEQGGSIELVGASSGSVPYLNFKAYGSSMADASVMLDADKSVSLASAVNNIKFLAGGTERMRVSSTGLVLIPGELNVAKLEIKNVTLPDYVFASSYRLRPLAEVERYVQENKHLPEVPSAAEVAANGQNVADMQNTLLKKVEELTLYLIEQNKQLEQQARLIEAQNKRIEELEKR